MADRPMISTYEPNAEGGEDLVYREMNDEEFAEYQGRTTLADELRQLEELFENNRVSLFSKASSALASNSTFLAIPTPTQAQALAQVQSLTKQVNALIRLLTKALDTLDGT